MTLFISKGLAHRKAHSKTGSVQVSLLRLLRARSGGLGLDANKRCSASCRFKHRIDWKNRTACADSAKLITYLAVLG
jgi:hypothetical protein